MRAAALSTCSCMEKLGECKEYLLCTSAACCCMSFFFVCANPVNVSSGTGSMSRPPADGPHMMTGRALNEERKLAYAPAHDCALSEKRKLALAVR